MESAPDIASFIARWSGSGAAERANYQLFLSELCDLLGVTRPDPTKPDDADNAYVFERSVTFHHPDGTTSTGRIDLYKRGCYVLEAKQGVEKREAAEAPADATKAKAKMRAAKGESEQTQATLGSEAFARLVGYKLVWGRDKTVTTEDNDFLGKKTTTAHDTLRGSFGNFDYGLIQRGGDCEVHLRRKREEADSSHSMQAVTTAFLHAVRAALNPSASAESAPKSQSCAR